MTLDEQYQQIIDDQRTHLMKLQEEFNKACDSSRHRAEEKLKTIPSEDKEGREGVLQDQKKELDLALASLKSEIEHSTRATMKKLEEIVRQKEMLELKRMEEEIAKL